MLPETKTIASLYFIVPDRFDSGGIDFDLPRLQITNVCLLGDRLFLFLPLTEAIATFFKEWAVETAATQTKPACAG
jgi:hypothetical protein